MLLKKLYGFIQKWSLLIVLFLSASPLQAEHIEKRRPSKFNLSVEGGSGLIKTLSPYSLEPGEVAAAFFVMNYDRYPGDIDFVELSVQGALGLPGRTELFFQYSPVFRTNSIDLDPLRFPIPPVDLFIDTFPEPADRPDPFLLYAQEVPYKTYFPNGITIRPPGDGAFAKSTGDLKFGVKFNLLDESRLDQFGLGFRVYGEVPTEKPAYNTKAWRSYAGVSGESNWGIDVLFSRMVGNAEILANFGYKKIGDPDRGLRIQYLNSGSQNPADFIVGPPVEFKLDLRDRLRLNGGTAMPIFELWGLPMWFVGELSHLRYVGNGTPVERLVHPWEMRLGLQANFPSYKAISLGFAWHLMFNDAGDGGGRFTTLVTPDGRGDINFSELVDPELSGQVQSFLSDRGVTFSENSSKVFSTNNPSFDHWRNIPVSPQKIVGQGGGAALFFLTWRIGTLWN